MKSLVQKALTAIAAMVITITTDATEIISVTNQTDFDQLDANLNASLRKGEMDIRVVLARGKYYYRDNHIDLSGKEYPHAKISITGKGAICVAIGNRYRMGDFFKGDFSYAGTCLDENLREVKIWTPLYQTNDLIEVVSSTSKLCRVKNLSGIERISPAGSYIQITSWYQSFVYKIERIEKGYIYFIATNLDKGFQGGWNVNNDYNFGRCYPRYRLCNVESGGETLFISEKGLTAPKGVKSVYVCDASRCNKCHGTA